MNVCREMKVANYKKEMLYVGCIAREAERYFMQFRNKLKSMVSSETLFSLSFVKYSNLLGP